MTKKMKNTVAACALSALALAVGIAGSQYTRHTFNEEITKLTSSKDAKSKYELSYKIEESGLFSQSGKLTITIRSHNRYVKDQVIKLKSDTLFLPTFTLTNIKPGNEQSQKFYDNFKIKKAAFSTFFQKGNMVLSTESEAEAPFKISLFGVDYSECKLTNGRLDVSIEDLAKLDNKNFEANATADVDTITCSERLQLKERALENDFLILKKLHLVTSLNQLISDDYSLSAPEFFKGSAEKLTLNTHNSSLNFKAIDVSRTVDVNKDKENNYINFFIDQGAVASHFKLEGRGDRYKSNEITGIKKGEYNIRFEGPFFVSLPHIKRLYDAGFLKRVMHGTEANLKYKINLDKVEPISGLSTPGAVKINVNGKETTANDLFYIMFSE